MANYKEYLEYSGYLEKLMEYIAEDNDSKYCNENLMYEVMYAERICEMYCFESVQSFLQAYKATKTGTMSGGITYNDLLKLRGAEYEFSKKKKGRSNMSYFVIGMIELILVGAMVAVAVAIGNMSIIKRGIVIMIGLAVIGALNIKISLCGTDDKIDTDGMQRDTRSSYMLDEMVTSGIEFGEPDFSEKGSMEYVAYNVNIEFEYEKYLRNRANGGGVLNE